MKHYRFRVTVNGVVESEGHFTNQRACEQYGHHQLMLYASEGEAVMQMHWKVPGGRWRVVLGSRITMKRTGK